MNFILKYKKLFAFLFWAWALLICYFSLTPNNPDMKITVGNNSTLRIDYFLHFIVYFCLAIFFLLWQTGTYLKLKSQTLIYFLIGALAFSALSEYIQTFIPGRTFNPNDFYSNVSGIILGMIIPRFFLK